jgi:bis(5'-adenosyl)-triphosphatase
MSVSTLFFATFDVTRQCFYRSRHSFAIVNLSPIVPGHTLLVSHRPVTRLEDLESHEIADLFTSVKTVGAVIKDVYGADGLTIACQVCFI